MFKLTYLICYAWWTCFSTDSRGRDRMVVGLQLPIQSVFITTDVSSTTKLDNIFATGGNNIVEVFESLTTSIWTMDTSLFSEHLGEFDAPSH